MLRTKCLSLQALDIFGCKIFIQPTWSRFVPVESFLPTRDLRHVSSCQSAAYDFHEDDEDVEQAEDQQLGLQLALVHRLQDFEATLSVDDVANGFALPKLLAAGRGPVVAHPDVGDSAANAVVRQLGAAAVGHAKPVRTNSIVILYLSSYFTENVKLCQICLKSNNCRYFGGQNRRNFHHFFCVLHHNL